MALYIQSPIRSLFLFPAIRIDPIGLSNKWCLELKKFFIGKKSQHVSPSVARFCVPFLSSWPLHQFGQFSLRSYLSLRLSSFFFRVVSHQFFSPTFVLWAMVCPYDFIFVRKWHHCLLEHLNWKKNLTQYASDIKVTKQ